MLSAVLVLTTCAFASDDLQAMTKLVNLVIKGRTLTIPDMSYRDVQQANGVQTSTNTITAACENSQVSDMSMGTMALQSTSDNGKVFRLDNVAVTSNADINYEESDFTYQGRGKFVAKSIKPNHFTVAISAVQREAGLYPPIEADVRCTPHNPGFTVEITPNSDKSTDPFDNRALKQRLANQIANGMVPFAKTAIASIVCMEIADSLKEVMNIILTKQFDLVSDQSNLADLFLNKAQMMLSLLINQTAKDATHYLKHLRGGVQSRLHIASIANLANVEAMRPYHDVDGDGRRWRISMNEEVAELEAPAGLAVNEEEISA